METWKSSPIVHRADGSYVVAHAGYSEYHVPNNDEFASFWAAVHAYAETHPEQVTEEPAPDEPTAAELLAVAKNIKGAEIDRVMAQQATDLMEPISALVQAIIAPASLTVAADSPATLTEESLEASKTAFLAIREKLVQNKALRAQVEAATSADVVNAITSVV